MSKNEKKALFHFLFIYFISTAIFVSIIAYMYYEKEVSTIKSHCSMKTSQMAWKIKSAILENFMEGKKFTFDTKDETVKYALIKQGGETYFSNLHYPLDFSLKKQAHLLPNKNIHVLALNDRNIPFKYIVVEDTSGTNALDNLQLKIGIFLFFGLLFILFFGYILGNILVSPIRYNFEQLNDFVKDSSHELNTPITALFMINSKLKKDENIDKKSLMQLEVSIKSIKQAYDSLLFRVNAKSIKRYDEKFELQKVVQEALLFFDELLKNKNITLHVELEKTEVFMDRYCANIVVNNLISNAIKYTKKDKNIFVSLKNNRLCIKDEGIGIKKEMQKKVFQRYQRGTKLEGGFGLGLDIVKSICKDYKIKIKLNSKLHEGSEFILIFPSLNLTNF